MRNRLTARLLLIALPLTIVGVAIFGVFLRGLTIGGPVPLATMLAPTEPVFAANMQIAPPQEG